MANKTKIPANRGLQRFSTGVNKKYSAPVFQDLAILDDSSLEPETNVVIPSVESVTDAKKWVDENRL